MEQSNSPGIARRTMLRRTLALGVAVALGGTAAARAATVEVGIHNFAFAPAKLQVKAGTMVTWVNHDDSPHSIVVPKLQVHSHAIDTDERFSLRFDQPGTYDYMCGLHPHMHGAVEVTP